VFDTGAVFMMIDPSYGGCLVQLDYHFQGGQFGDLVHCDGEVAWVGVHTYTHPKQETVQGFACDKHRGQLDHPRPFGSHAADHLVLARRRAR
jgi:hypothetical protein